MDNCSCVIVSECLHGASAPFIRISALKKTMKFPSDERNRTSLSATTDQQRLSLFVLHRKSSVTQREGLRTAAGRYRVSLNKICAGTKNLDSRLLRKDFSISESATGRFKLVRSVELK